jgi:hypothetical protein
MPDLSTHEDRISASAQMLIGRVIRILKGCGVSAAELREISEKEILGSQSTAQPHASAATARQLITCSDVVLRWRRDAKFLTSEGLPSLLSVDGASPSFGDLVRTVSPENNFGELLTTMLELGVVRTNSPEEIELISESVVACSGRDGFAIASVPVLEHLCGFLGSVEYNLFEKPSRVRGRFERACYASVPENLVPVLEKLVSSRGQDFVDAIDEWLARRAVRPERDGRTVLVGAGAYVFVRENVDT